MLFYIYVYMYHFMFIYQLQILYIIIYYSHIFVCLLSILLRLVITNLVQLFLVTRDLSYMSGGKKI